MSKMGQFTPERQAELDARQRRQEEHERMELKKASRERALRCLREAKIPPRYESANLDDLSFARDRLDAHDFAVYAAVCDDLKYLLDAPAGTVIIRGDNGPGKTHLSCGLIRAFCEQGRPARIISARGFFRELASTFGSPGRTQSDLFDKFRNYELLVIDEFEVHVHHEYQAVELRDLVNERYQHCVSTIIITNKPAAELRSYFPSAFLSRVRDHGAVLNCDWPDLRGREPHSIRPVPTINSH